MVIASIQTIQAIQAAQRALVESPRWLHVMGQIAGTMLLVELLIALAVVCALMGGLAYGAWWTHRNVIPIVNDYAEQAQNVMAKAERGGEAVVERVATFHGAQKGVLTGLRVFLFGRPEPARAVTPLTPPTAPTVATTTAASTTIATDTTATTVRATETTTTRTPPTTRPIADTDRTRPRTNAADLPAM